jgi:chorismate mutase
MTTATTPLVPSIDAGRELIDDLDAQIVGLLAQRRAVSARIQQLRIDAGGSRVEHSRENAVIRRWADALGDGGVELALAVLAVCRGRR